MHEIFPGCELMARAGRSERDILLVTHTDDDEPVASMEDFHRRKLDSTLLLLGALSLSEMTGEDYGAVLDRLHEEGCHWPQD